MSEQRQSLSALIVKHSPSFCLSLSVVLNPICCPIQNAKTPSLSLLLAIYPLKQTDQRRFHPRTLRKERLRFRSMLVISRFPMTTSQFSQSFFRVRYCWSRSDSVLNLFSVPGQTTHKNRRRKKGSRLRQFVLQSILTMLTDSKREKRKQCN